MERGNIFQDMADGNNFLERFGGIIQETKTHCFAWALIPNHFHLLLKTGMTPIATVMRRLLTGYATLVALYTAKLKGVPQIWVRD